MLRLPAPVARRRAKRSRARTLSQDSSSSFSVEISNECSRSQARRGGGGSASGRMPDRLGGEAIARHGLRRGRRRDEGRGGGAIAAQAIMQSSAMRWPLPWSGMGRPAQCDAIAIARHAPPSPGRCRSARTAPAPDAARTKSWMMRRRLTWAWIGLPRRPRKCLRNRSGCRARGWSSPDPRRRGGRCGRCGRAGGCS